MADRERWGEEGGGGWDDRGSDWSRQERERQRRDRGMMDRGADEVRSWFGDDEAQRRRQMDDRRDREAEMRYRERGYGERGHSPMRAGGPESADYRSTADWEGRERGPETRRASAWSGGGYGVGYGAGSYGLGRSSAPPAAHGREAWPGGSSRPGSGSFAGRGPRNYQRSDERIRDDVNDRLTDDPRVDAIDIEVRVQNGEVTLAGHVPDRRMRREAEECVEDLPGVRDVHNELRVDRGADVTSLNIGGSAIEAAKKR